MLRHAFPIGWLWIFGAITVPAGLWLWHGQGPHFGLGLVGGGKVNVVAAYLCLATFLTLLALGFAVDGE